MTPEINFANTPPSPGSDAGYRYIDMVFPIATNSVLCNSAAIVTSESWNYGTSGSDDFDIDWVDIKVFPKESKIMLGAVGHFAGRATYNVFFPCKV